MLYYLQIGCKNINSKYVWTITDIVNNKIYENIYDITNFCNNHNIKFETLLYAVNHSKYFYKHTWFVTRIIYK